MSNWTFPEESDAPGYQRSDQRRRIGQSSREERPGSVDNSLGNRRSSKINWTSVLVTYTSGEPAPRGTTATSARGLLRALSALRLEDVKIFPDGSGLLDPDCPEIDLGR
jgi:hypothetical protein